MSSGWLRTLAIAGLAAAAAAQAEPGAADDERVTRTAAGRASDHAADELRAPTEHEIVRRPASEVPRKPRTSAKPGEARVASAAYGDSWVYEATTEAFADRDADGYFSYLRVRFDVDTLYTYSYVYAEIYVSADGETWEHLYSTDDFAVYGSDPEDDYEVETELVSGYTAALYDVLIEIYDADDGTLVDEYGPNESPEFSMLPLEDSARDGAVPPPPPPHDHGGGGALPWLAVPALLGALYVRRRRRAE